MFNHHHDAFRSAPDWAVALRDMLALTFEQGFNIMSAIDDLAASVAAEDTVIDSAVALIEGFAAQLAAAGVDPAKLDALKSDIAAKTAVLAAAVAAQAPAPPPVVAPPATAPAPVDPAPAPAGV